MKSKSDRLRISLRRRRVSDADVLFPAMSDPDVMRWWARAPFASVEELRQDFFDDERSNWRSWAIVLPGKDRAIGFVAAGQKREGVSEIGYLLAREAQGQGYGREAVSLLIEQLFAERQRHIFADIDPDNLPSMALLAALGFQLEGRLRAEWCTHIGVRDSLVYGLLAEEWRR